MFYNGANYDIYIGKGARKKLLNDIHDAKKSIKIISPYLSPFLISELIRFQKRNLSIELITTDNIEDFYGNYERNIHKLIIQNQKTNKEAVEKREKWKDISKILTYMNYRLLAILISLITTYLKDSKIIIGIIPIIYFMFCYKTL